MHASISGCAAHVWQVETVPSPPIAVLYVENINDVNMFQYTTVGFFKPCGLQVRNDLYDTSCCCLHDPKVFNKADLMEKLLHLPSFLKNSNNKCKKVIFSTGVKVIVLFLEFSDFFLGLKAENHYACLFAHCFFIELLSYELLE